MERQALSVTELNSYIKSLVVTVTDESITYPSAVNRPSEFARTCKRCAEVNCFGIIRLSGVCSYTYLLYNRLLGDLAAECSA